MKRLLYIACALGTLLAGCTETTEIGPGEYTEPANLGVSTDKLIFDVEGGIAAIVVATNLESWDFNTDGDWFTIEKKDNILEISAPINVTTGILNGSVVISGQRDGQVLSANVAISQGAERSMNLSAVETSNCYLVKTNGAYKFDASVKGNGKGDGQSTYIQKYGLEITGVTYADLLWEARNDGDKTMSREIIDGSPIYKDGYVSFRTGRSQGNAVISVKDVKGDILWSWHIWVSDDEVKVHDHTNATLRVVAQVMDRNLGALNNTPLDIDNRGMFYQWGRKDPFMPSRSPYVPNANGDNKPTYNLTNWEVGNGSGEWIFNGKMLPFTLVPGNIPNTVLNPMLFLQNYYSEYYDWYCASGDQAVTDSGLWDEKKTIFDPCPVGYRVPGKDIWGVPSGNKTITNAGGVSEYDENGENEKWDWNVFKDCGRIWKFTGDYYPAVGNVYYGSINNNTHNYASSQAFYWTCQRTPNRDSEASYAADFNLNWGQYRTMSHVFSAQVRCVKE